MLSDVLSSVAAALLPLAIGAAVVYALVSATDAVLALRWRTLRLTLEKLLLEARREQHDSAKSDGQLRADCKRDATRILRMPDGSRAAWIRPDTLQQAVVRVAGLDARTARSLRNAFTDARRAMRKRFARHMRAWTVVWSAVVSATSLIVLPATGYGPWQDWTESVDGLQPVALGGLAAVVTATILVAIGAHLCFRLQRSRFGTPGGRAAPPPPTSEGRPVDGPPIGCDDCAVRAINFAAGGFSTIMQLGVTHALMTIQGRAPDAVIGVSAGAVQAAALAEVLQAGDEIESEYEPWNELGEERKVELQTRRMQARSTRFREFLAEYQTARERLFDSVLPDAYQVDSYDPLRPLQSPLYDRKERDTRLRALETKSGLIRLYNDMLRLNIPVGVIVRVIRRVLGFQASGNLSTWLRRNYVRLLECVKVWLLIGGVLMRASPIVGPLRRALLSGAAQKVRAGTAESIIFRFRIAENARKALEASSNFFVLLLLWLGIGLAPAAIPAWIWDREDSHLEIIAGILVIYIAVPLAFSVAFHRSGEAIGKTFRGLAQALWLVAKWTAFLYLLLSVSIAVVAGIIDAIETRNLSAFGATAGFAWDRNLLLRMICAIPVISGIVIALLLLKFSADKLRYFRVLRGNAEPSDDPGLGGRLLASYQISQSLFNAYPLRKVLAPLFDRDYFGKLDMDDSIASALLDEPQSSHCLPCAKKTVGQYASPERPRPIHVGLAVANVCNGALETVPADESVVDGLAAAFAALPLFPPQRLGGSLYVDGSNVANVPTRALLSMLRNRINPRSHGVHIYSVVPLPFSRPHLYSKEEQSLSHTLWDTAMKALYLQRFRDAVVERRLTELYTRVIPREDADGNPNYRITIGSGAERREFFRGWVTPVELEEPVSLNERVLMASREERHTAILETVADGCRASLETMIRLPNDQPMSCRLAVRRHLEQQQAAADLPREIVETKLPGAGRYGPGLREVCENCALYRNQKGREKKQTLALRELAGQRPPWPHERLVKDEHFTEPIEDTVGDVKGAADVCGADPFRSLEGWPRRGKDATISMLFSGGVFRGVYQMGVLNALSLLGLKPDAIAGASVGSITAGMVTKVFSGADDTRQQEIARLAAVYLGVDRLILTDQFDSFVRNLTIRAAATKFSVSEADYVFRKYDFPSPNGYSRSARDVIAGIERLLYVNPYQLNALVSAIRNTDYRAAFELVRKLTQQWLDRMDVGEQVLGADALNALIEHFVIPDWSRDDSFPASFDEYDGKLIHLLATTTNLTKGELEILGGIDPASGRRTNSALLEGLLASSAFPGVFRPRLSHNLHPGTAEEHQYIDGGVMDNFPIDAAIQLLLAGVRWGKIRHGFDDPTRPHLIFAASLQINTPEYRHDDEWKKLANNWPALLARAKELGYNAKLDTYEAAERNLRRIYTKVRDAAGTKDPDALKIDFTPLNIEVVTVKPEWLCGTFAFHPMLGFRRRSQAMSIAHGCASTLLKFKSVDSRFRKAWGVDEDAIPVESGVGKAWEHWREHSKSKGAKPDGECWLRPGEICPFSRASLIAMNERLARNGGKTVPSIDHVARIHELCVDPSTHMPNGDSIGWVERALRRRQLLP